MNTFKLKLISTIIVCGLRVPTSEHVSGYFKILKKFLTLYFLQDFSNLIATRKNVRSFDARNIASPAVVGGGEWLNQIVQKFRLDVKKKWSNFEFTKKFRLRRYLGMLRHSHPFLATPLVSRLF